MLLDTLLAPLLPIAAPAAPAPQFHGEGRVRTSLHVGLRALDADFEPAEDQFLLGLVVDVREPGKRTGFEAGYLRSWGDGRARIGANTVGADSCLHEFFLGARWNYDPFESRLRPYLGAGLSLLLAEYEVEGLGTSSSDSAFTAGLYGHGGVEWHFGDGWAIGLDVRALVADHAELQADASLDSLATALTLSWGW